ncbi:OmpA family protein [Planctobacterium marinum]|uniref:OmpA family protein n=1 Tax=Planctobacterium marinum TaxID=1631968 RepID=UPI001E651FAA|nr:OmpA family protein [Planctobacterium marinum]MCC2607028.1 OmpA family protein [Planctobacterium marinum]
MKKTLMALIISTSITPYVAANNDTDQEYWWFGLSGEMYSPDEDRPGALGSGWGFGEEFGYRFNADWAGRIELTGLNADLERERLQTGDPVNDAGMRYGADVLYYLNSRDTYVFTGLKRETLGDEPNLLNLGLGKHWRINDSWALISEATWYRELGDNHNNLGARLGIAYKFGHSAPAAKHKDDDQDGVADYRDNCPYSETAAVNADGCQIAEPEDAINTVTFTAFFEHDSAVVQKQDSEQLKAFAARARFNPKATLRIEGHASRPGTNEYNFDLSKRRAEAIKSLLIEHYGVAADRITVVAYGETDLLSSQKTIFAEKLNRRIEATLTIEE